MAIFFHTNSAGTLLKEFCTQIAQPEKSGKVITWAINSDNFYTHKSTQWGEKAWLKARVEAHQLTFKARRQLDAALVEGTSIAESTDIEVAVSRPRMVRARSVSPAGVRRWRA